MSLHQDERRTNVKTRAYKERGIHDAMEKKLHIETQ